MSFGWKVVLMMTAAILITVAYYQICWMISNRRWW